MENDTKDMERAAQIAFIRRRMGELGLNQRSLALRSGCKQDAVRNLLSGKSKNWRGDIQQKIMGFLSQNKVAILGTIGAGDSVELIYNFDKIIKKSPGELKLAECETFVVPSELSHRTVHAWKVEKDWEGPLLTPGDILWTTEIRYNGFENYINSEVLVTLHNSRTYIKKLMRGSSDDKYSLLGVSVHGFLKDVDIAWVAQIAGHIKKLSL